jgi:hypothetical protein
VLQPYSAAAGGHDLDRMFEAVLRRDMKVHLSEAGVLVVRLTGDAVARGYLQLLEAT